MSNPVSSSTRSRQQASLGANTAQLPRPEKTVISNCGQGKITKVLPPGIDASKVMEIAENVGVGHEAQASSSSRVISPVDSAPYLTLLACVALQHRQSAQSSSSTQSAASDDVMNAVKRLYSAAFSVNESYTSAEPSEKRIPCPSLPKPIVDRNQAFPSFVPQRSSQSFGCPIQSIPAICSGVSESAGNSVVTAHHASLLIVPSLPSRSSQRVPHTAVESTASVTIRQISAAATASEEALPIPSGNEKKAFKQYSASMKKLVVSVVLAYGGVELVGDKLIKQSMRRINWTEHVVPFIKTYWTYPLDDDQAIQRSCRYIFDGLVHKGIRWATQNCVNGATDASIEAFIKGTSTRREYTWIKDIYQLVENSCNSPG